MKMNPLPRPRGSRAIGAFLLLSALPVIAETTQEMNSWAYHTEWDKLNNVQYSLVRSPLPQRGLYDRLRLELICKNNALQFALDANSLITSKGSAFDFEYQIDKHNPVTITMKTYSDTKRRGYSDDHIETIVQDMLSGQSMFVRAHTIIRTVLSSEIPLQGAKQSIQRVFDDCGMALPGQETGQPDYSLSDLERDIKALAPEQQRQVLDKIKELIDGLR